MCFLSTDLGRDHLSGPRPKPWFLVRGSGLASLSPIPMGPSYNEEEEDIEISVSLRFLYLSIYVESV